MHVTLATLPPECVFEDTVTGQAVNGREGAARHYRPLPAMVGRVQPGLFARRADRWTADGSYVAEGVYSGHHVGPFLG